VLVHLRRSFIFLLLATLVCGFGYAFAGTGLSQVLFPAQANGSLSAQGSALIGQPWTSPDFFHGRPDDAGPYRANPSKGISGGDNALMTDGVWGTSGATNLGPRSATLLADTRALVAYWHRLGVNPTPDLVTTSGSGYDPDLSPADARCEIPMVARAAGLSAATLNQLITEETRNPSLGFLGEPYVNVLALNEALARLRAGRK
jgi:K+-transporting ATPase ATPase C chain